MKASYHRLRGSRHGNLAHRRELHKFEQFSGRATSSILKVTQVVQVVEETERKRIGELYLGSACIAVFLIRMNFPDLLQCLDSLFLHVYLVMVIEFSFAQICVWRPFV